MAIRERIYTNWCVISGAPSSGKTSVINLLESKGFEVVHDVARNILSNQNDIPSQRSVCKLQNEILYKLKQIIDELDPGKLIFFEYGMPDNLVFQRIGNIEIPETEIISEYLRYKKVYILEPLVFVNDGIRDKDKEKQYAIYEDIKSTYIRFGYHPAIVPAGSVEGRVNSIIRELQELS